MSISETKLAILDALYNRGIFIKKVDSREYVTRCPFCGDSVNSKNKGHLYMKIDLNDESPIQYHCFKCESGGILNPSNMPLFGIDDEDLKNGIEKLNGSSRSQRQTRILERNEVKSFDFIIPEIERNDKSKYIEERLGISLRDVDLEEMKYISSFKEFLKTNQVPPMCKDNIVDFIDSNYVGFLSFGNSHILFRDISGKQNIRWLKYPITEESKQNRIFYSTKLAIARMETEPIRINLAEGIMDILSVKHNLGYNTQKDINIAVSGKSYDKILLFMISNTFFGSNVTVNIFSDNDAGFNDKKNATKTTVEWYRDKIGTFKPLFQNINIFYNMIGKDVGVPKEKIVLQKYRL